MKAPIYILIALLLFGCAEQQPPSNKPILFVSIPPQAGLTKAIVGELVEIYTLVGEGQSPHTYEPTARQLAKLGEADALITIGVPFEERLLRKIAPLYPDLRIVEAQAGIELRTMRNEHQCEDCTHDHDAKDPHIWLCPLNAIAISHNTLKELEKIDPDHIDTYRTNYKQLTSALRQLDDRIRTILAPHKGSRFYVFHPSFGYFADAYGLEQLSVELDGKSPTPHHLTGLIKKAKTDEVKVVFVQKQFPAGSAQVVADAIDGTVVQLDPLSEDVVANLQQIAEHIVQALEP